MRSRPRSASTRPGLTDHIITTANGSTNTLEITAAEPTADEAVRVADTFADQLIAGLQKRDTDRYNAQRTYLSTRIDNLNNTVNGLKAQLAGDPTNQVIAAQLNAAANELGIAYSDFGNLTATGPPTSRLSVLEKAQAVPIKQPEYDSRLNLGALGQNHLNAGLAYRPADDRHRRRATAPSTDRSPAGCSVRCSACSAASGWRSCSSACTAGSAPTRTPRRPSDFRCSPRFRSSPARTRSRSSPRARPCRAPPRPIEQCGRRSSSRWPRSPTSSAPAASTATEAPPSSSPSRTIRSW